MKPANTKTLTEKIKSNPYLKASNLCDEQDCKDAIDDIRNLRRQYPESKMLRNLYFKIEYKRMKFAGIIKD